MARKISKAKVSEQIERDEEQKRIKRKAIDELELRRLTRQARMMKEAKLKDAFVEKNKKVKNIIIKENDDLLDNLSLMKSKRRCLVDTKQAQNIANLFAQGDGLDAAIAQEKDYIRDLESQIQKDTVNVQSVKRTKGANVVISEYMQKRENERAARTLEAWNSRLAAEQSQLASTINENKEMRAKLQQLLKQKGQFNKLFEELMAKLNKGKRVMAEIVEQSRIEFQKRDEVSRKIEALKNRDKADLVKRMEEMQNLEKKFYEDQRLADFRSRVQFVREKLVDGVRKSNKDTVEQEKLTKRLEMANELLDLLKETTGLNTSDEIYKSIVNEESCLFSMFNFNNEIRDQLEVLTQKTVDVIRTVDDEQMMAEERMEQELKSRNSMERKLETLEQTYNDLEDHYEANARMFRRLLDKTKALFDLTKCRTTVLQDLLGNNQQVTEHNYKLYLSLVETEVITNLECLTLSFPVHHTRAGRAISAKTLSVRSMAKVKSTISIINKKVVTNACGECEGTVRPKWV
ncbi:outer dynein arm-docking complex subunit 1-like [Macrosteles quadrilineatus]|uniref:outer dynein arm-docking complex subunit 1-like n=1 Tax=Macrosteles quadrilineatus TaxID=74068 RepID=UPI0023E302AB|nr:outer dynein arm-docking complex subunit 1-like [Macrosteles quadrilineatus]